MGLDIYTYTDVVEISEEEYEQFALMSEAEQESFLWSDCRVRIFCPEGLEHALPPLKVGQIYRTRRTHHFRAGSYSGYSVWRRSLASMVGIANIEEFWDDPAPGPFSELIDFSDCEGFIGKDVASKLHKDFVTYQELANNTTHSPERFLENYQNFTTAFYLASAQNGFVLFG